jgi:hypothetical protein
LFSNPEAIFSEVKIPEEHSAALLMTIPKLMPLKISIDLTITDVEFDKIDVIQDALKAEIKQPSCKKGKL